MGNTHSNRLTLEQFLEDYSRRRNLFEENKPRLFALCAVDNLVARYVRSKYRETDVFVDGQNDTGIDGIGIIVNDKLVTSVEDIDRAIQEDRDMNVRFVFVQATMDREFKENKMTTFAHGVWKFFHPDELGPRSERISEAIALKDAIFARTQWMRSGRPTLHMYYISAGQWVGDSVLEGAITSGEALLEGTDRFKYVDYTPLDFRGFLDLRRSQQRRNSGEVHSYMLQRLPEIEGVGSSFLGAMLVNDLISIIRHPSSDRLNRNVFIENVRGFQGVDNVVNSGINKTLARRDVAVFPLLNNGVTIVCREYEMVGPKLRMFDYQIVNGCQTSSVIFANRKNLKDKELLVPAKIVVTRDEAIIENIIRSTNSQTEVKEDHILSLLPFNRRLAEYYRAIILGGTGEKIYYDLREGEFASNKNIDEHRIVQIKDQLQSFASMFLARPHQAIENLQELRDDVPDKIFNPDHALDPYYTASLALFRFKDLVEDRLIEPVFQNYRFQILHVLRKKLFPEQFNLYNWKAAPILCNEANERLFNREQSIQLFGEACEVIRAAAVLMGVEDLIRDAASRKGFTDAVDEVMRPFNNRPH